MDSLESLVLSLEIRVPLPLFLQILASLAKVFLQIDDGDPEGSLVLLEEAALCNLRSDTELTSSFSFSFSVFFRVSSTDAFSLCNRVQ